MPVRSDTVMRRRRVLELYNDGRTQPEIAALLEMPRATVAYDLKNSPGYTPRPTLKTYAPGPGRITANDAAKRHGLKLWTLMAAIDAGRVRGERVELGKRTVRTVDQHQFEQDLTRLPTCIFEGCDKLALAPGGGCCGPHGAIRVNRGSRLSPETRAKIAAAKRGKPRPDLAAKHLDKRWEAQLVDKAMRGRKAVGQNISVVTLRRTGGRAGAFQPPKQGARRRGRPAKTTSEQESQVLDLRLNHPEWGRVTLSRMTGLTEKQVRRILDRSE